MTKFSLPCFHFALPFAVCVCCSLLLSDLRGPIVDVRRALPAHLPAGEDVAPRPAAAKGEILLLHLGVVGVVGVLFLSTEVSP